MSGPKKKYKRSRSPSIRLWSCDLINCRYPDFQSDSCLRVVHGLEWLPLGFVVEISTYKIGREFSTSIKWHPHQPTEDEYHYIQTFIDNVWADYTDPKLLKSRVREWRGL